jgi:hypothetical protein
VRAASNERLQSVKSNAANGDVTESQLCDNKLKLLVPHAVDIIISEQDNGLFVVSSPDDAVKDFK